MFLKALQKISKFATEIEDKEENMAHVTNYYGNDLDKIEIPEDFKEIQYYFKKGNGSWLTLYKESEINDNENEEKEKQELERAEREERRTRLEEMKERSYELRLEFIQGISNTKARRHMDAIIEATIYEMINGGSVWISDVAKSFGIEDDADDKWKSIQQEIWKQPEKNLLTLVYNSLDNGYQSYFRWDLTYMESKDLDYIYEFLETLGYKLSEEERQIKEGIHELFMNSEKI